VKHPQPLRLRQRCGSRRSRRWIRRRCSARIPICSAHSRRLPLPHQVRGSTWLSHASENRRFLPESTASVARASSHLGLGASACEHAHNPLHCKHANPYDAGRTGGGGNNGGSRTLRTPPRQPQPQPGGGVESPSPRRPPTPTSVSNHARAVQDSCVLPPPALVPNQTSAPPTLTLTLMLPIRTQSS